MANLVNLKEFDRELATVLAMQNKFSTSMAFGGGKTWSKQQAEDLMVLHSAIKAIWAALYDLANSNRDGRG